MTAYRSLAAATLLGVLAAAATLSHAQAVYRIVGPDGRVTFSDRPPPDTGGGKATLAPVGPAGSAENFGSLPFELRTAASKYPVVLYARPGCAPCDTGRSFLVSRGIPFTEKMVTTNEDLEALQRLSGALTLPFITIGGQQIKGFAELEWTGFLDAAGYPKTSQLPPGYRRPAPTPLVVASRPAERPAEGEATPLPVPSTPSSNNPNNPANIQF
ncbi:MAG TPA: glutaredoxin family protein [Ramlibacter sp.]|uniref:glutaredoxin family protein n=1 Tax=Ramlibacter sp. TaxID=1917967 RepID=UPI002B88500C|nr:glutaredoxin family protein [Ramlibacter sp.]HVZ43008.1 glutaredoxin family protein [Ramlibacter sp.]